MHIDWSYSAAGLGIGFLVGLTGVGGGALMTPVLMLLFGVAPRTAVGTDLWVAAVTKLVGGTVHQHHGSVDWEVFRRLSAGSIPTAVLTLVWLHTSAVQSSQDARMMTALGVVLIVTAVATIFRQKVHAVGNRLRETMPTQFKLIQPALTVFAGAILGFLVTFTSVGAGALGAVMLLYLYPKRMKPAKLIGTDLVHAVPLTIVAGTGHLLLGNVNYVLMLTLLLGSVPGVIIGSFASSRAPENVIRAAIALALVASGIKMISL
ncbi:sulfite exporter TauE/SafE family protein [Solimonas terrae]|uniref:Probable membrane transporter protein n=1 Tax=Solimonas terrae TaxID=1396819 RepID=A0A6M2BR26_9GAMM|nr:sulfite exporter TauE/SafE family protein [Solimonas terrae]NGY04533.1 sulfite exporter TauE/SafE family protein [Solimonas terrae]